MATHALHEIRHAGNDCFEVAMFPVRRIVAIDTAADVSRGLVCGDIANRERCTGEVLIHSHSWCCCVRYAEVAISDAAYYRAARESSRVGCEILRQRVGAIAVT